MLVFYAQTAPRWWPFQAVSVSSQRLPALAPEALGEAMFFVDNGAFSGRTFTHDLGLWYSRLISFVDTIARRYPSARILVVLPDRIDDGRFTLEAARHPGARSLCHRYPGRLRCAAVAHAVPGDVNGRRRVAEELASLEHVSVLAAPLKANCRRRPTAPPDRRCQLEIARMVCSIAKAHTLTCHLLAPRLDKTLAVLAQLPAVESFDTAAWMRPRVGGGYSPAYGFGKSGVEQRFREKLCKLLEYGVPLRLPPRPNICSASDSSLQNMTVSHLSHVFPHNRTGVR